MQRQPQQALFPADTDRSGPILSPELVWHEGGVRELEPGRLVAGRGESHLDLGGPGIVGHVAGDPGPPETTGSLAGEDRSAGIPFELVPPADAVVAADRQEPA